LNTKFNKDFKNVLKPVIILLQVGFYYFTITTSDFVSDCPFKLSFCQLKF